MTDLTSIQLYLRNLVPTSYMKLGSGSGLSLAPVQLSGQPGQVAGARNIQLPKSVSKQGGGGVPVTREQHGVSGNVSTGYVTFVLANSRFVSRSRTVRK